MRKKVILIILVIIFFIASIFVFLSQTTKNRQVDTEEITPISIENLHGTQYLTIQIFTGVLDSETLIQSFPPPEKNIAATVSDIIRAIGSAGDKNRKLGFIVGPISFDNTDEQVRQLIRDSFTIALEKNIAVGFHIDDSMFWGRLAYLNKPDNIEWLDWNKTLNTGRRVDWSSTPTKIMPQLCINSPAVKAEVAKRASLIGEEVKRGLETLNAAGKPELFVGVIAGWETQIGRDFDSKKYLGYCALTNKGYNVGNPPKDIDEARTEIVKEFVDFWTKSLYDAGVPDEKIFSHTALMSKSLFDFAKSYQPSNFPSTYLETVNFAPARVSFGFHHYAGFSTYPQFGLLEQIQDERVKNSNPPWASSEGTAIDPGDAEKGKAGTSMETYLGNMFNHGAILVNVFGWGIGDSNNPFRKVAENPQAIAAYQKFLRGETLKENAKVQLPSPEFYAKVQRLQKELPPYLSNKGVDSNEREKVGALYETLNQQLNSQHYTDAETTIDAILKIIEK